MFTSIPKGIVGSKDYRKPEWVTQMEEMQVALKGMYSRLMPALLPLLCVYVF